MRDPNIAWRSICTASERLKVENPEAFKQLQNEVKVTKEPFPRVVPDEFKNDLAAEFIQGKFASGGTINFVLDMAVTDNEQRQIQEGVCVCVCLCVHTQTRTHIHTHTRTYV